MSEETRGPQATSGLGFMLVILIVAFTAAGYGFDRWLGTAPWLMVAGVFVGFGLGLTYLVLILMSDSSGRRTPKRKRQEDEGPDEGQ